MILNKLAASLSPISERDAGAARFCATAATDTGVISGADDAVFRVDEKHERQKAPLWKKLIMAFHGVFPLRHTGPGRYRLFSVAV